ncbi:Ig-like domain-containing protein, partial [Candidatus Nitrosotalea okcheonensis]|uniref:Ig-like domain-containing protein n=1 Tax=Candidatus Nitrosotalea okcheonensis TaxID=1903276 RepID=UPI00138FF47F
YGGDATNAASSGQSTLTVNKVSTTTTLTLLPSSVNVGIPTTVSVSVTGSSPTGTVTFASNSTGSFSNAGSCTLNSAKCSVTFTPSSVGSAVITASYGGDATNAASSGQSTLTVNKVSTTTTLTLLPSSVNVGIPTTVSVSVTGSSPTGTVTFASNSTGSFSNAGSCTLNSAKCSVTFTPSSVGSAVITANYGGDATNAASSGTSNLTVTQSTSSTFDAYNQFDPVTKNVLVYGIDNNGDSFGPITPTITKTSWNSGDDYNLDNHDHDASKLGGNDNHKNNGGNDNHKNTKVSFVPNLTNSIVMTSWSSINYDANNLGDIILVADNHKNNGGNANNHHDESDNHKNNGGNDKSGAIYNHDDDNKNAELRTFHINNGNNSLILIEKVLMGNNKITVHVISIQRNGGPVVQMPQNLKMFEWTNDKDNDGSSPGNMEKFQQTMIIKNDKLTQQITTSYNDDKKQTVIYTQNINEDFKHKNHLSDEIVKNGLVYLRMLTHQNILTIGTS